jgi:cysteine synthase
LSDFAGKRLDFFVSGWGTGGTLTGVGEMIRLARPEVQIIATEPEAAAMLSGKPWSPHKIQGWTPNLVPEVLNREVPHRIVPVTDAEAIEAARTLARQEGIFCGISSGGTFAAALKVAREARWSSRCCRTRASATSPPRCSRESLKVAIRSPDSHHRALIPDCWLMLCERSVCTICSDCVATSRPRGARPADA